MLKDIIDFVQSRSDLTSREDVLREINNAWQEIWNSDDLPNSLQEISVTPLDNTARISLPYFVGEIRAVKDNRGKLRITLNTPRPLYQSETFYQSPYTWRVLGTSPLSISIENATQLTYSISEPLTEDLTITAIGPDDNATTVRDQVILPAGETSINSVRRFTDVTSLVKNILTPMNVVITGANGEDYGIIPNLFYEAKNTIIQIIDKCMQCCTNCRCFDILFKLPAPILYYDEQNVPFPQVLIMKTLEYITLPKEGQEKKALAYSEKSRALLANFNANERGVEKKIDLGQNLFTSWTGSSYYGKI